MPPSASPNAGFAIELDPIEWALVQFFARQRQESPARILAKMLDAYVKGDKRFVPNDFLAFVRTELAPATADRATRDQLLREVVRFAKDQHMANEPTATLVEQAPPRRSTGKR